MVSLTGTFIAPCAAKSLDAGVRIVMQNRLRIVGRLSAMLLLALASVRGSPRTPVLIVAVTEKRDRGEIDTYADALRKVLA